MSDELPLTPAAQRRVIGPDHYRSIQQAGRAPVESHPADDAMSLVESIVARPANGRGRGNVQTRVGADGTSVDVAWGQRGPTRIIRVSPHGGESHGTYSH